MPTVSTLVNQLESLRYVNTQTIEPVLAGTDVDLSDVASRYVLPIVRHSGAGAAVDVYVNNAASAIRIPAASTEAIPLMLQLASDTFTLFDATGTAEVIVDLYEAVI